MNYLTTWAKAKKVLVLSGLIFVFAQIFAGESLAQKRRAVPRFAKKQIVTKKAKPTAAAQNLNLPKVTQINEVALRKLLKREDANAKPLLINFWATWCDPCREEFPDLVKLDADYADKIDLITISLDELSEINGDVPKFLAQMKAEMPSYLLKTPDEEAAIAAVSKSWQGALPFTILLNGQGETAYFIQGKFKNEILRAEIEKLFQSTIQQSPFEKGMEDAERDIAEGKLVVKANERDFSHGLPMLAWQKNQVIEENPLEKYKIALGFTHSYKREKLDYMSGYNSVSLNEIKKRYGEDVLNQIKKKYTVNYQADVIKLELTQK
jgi:thiol-disulfide isomerase/thioredoxin